MILAKRYTSNYLLSRLLPICLIVISMSHLTLADINTLKAELKPYQKLTRQELANKVINHPNIGLSKLHTNGIKDAATPYLNVVDFGLGKPAKLSSYGRAPGGSTEISEVLLQVMLALAHRGFKFRVTEIAGGQHSYSSRHYLGLAFDINELNNRPVNNRNPYYKRFMALCRKLGATEVLGPGDADHSNHIHLAWPRSLVQQYSKSKDSNFNS